MVASIQLKLPDLSTPSVMDQTDWDCGFFNFPNRYKIQYFNPGIVDWMNNRWLVARRRRCWSAIAKNDIVFWRLDASHRQPISEHQLKFPSLRHDEHWEDPRAVVVNGQLWVSYSNFYTRGYWVHQGIARVNNLLQAGSVCHPVYGDNGIGIRENKGHEKNWLWFAPRDEAEHGGRMLMVYAACPHTIVRFDEDGPRTWEGKGFRWSKGQIRGGTPPVYVEEDNLYWTFFHSSIDLGPTPPRRRYYMGAYAFEPNPPFRIVFRTSTPLLVGSEKDRRDMGAPLCVFPCGAILDKPEGVWLVTFGVNDCACAWIKIPHGQLWDRMIRVR